MRIFNLTDINGPEQNIVLGSVVIHPGDDGTINDDYVLLFNKAITEYTRNRKISVNSLPPDVAAKRARKKVNSTFLDKRDKKEG